MNDPYSVADFVMFQIIAGAMVGVGIAGLVAGCMLEGSNARTHWLSGLMIIGGAIIGFATYVA